MRTGSSRDVFRLFYGFVATEVYVRGAYILVLYNTGMTENPFTFPDGSKVFATHIDFTDLLQKRITDHAD